jgi:hypothetical protein
LLTNLFQAEELEERLELREWELGTEAGRTEVDGNYIKANAKLKF